MTFHPSASKCHECGHALYVHARISGCLQGECRCKNGEVTALSNRIIAPRRVLRQAQEHIRSINRSGAVPGPEAFAYIDAALAEDAKGTETCNSDPT